MYDVWQIRMEKKRLLFLSLYFSDFVYIYMFSFIYLSIRSICAFLTFEHFHLTKWKVKIKKKELYRLSESGTMKVWEYETKIWDQSKGIK